MKPGTYFNFEAREKIKKLIKEKVSEICSDLTDYVDKLVALIVQDHGYFFILASIEGLFSDEDSCHLALWICSLREILDQDGNFKDGIQEPIPTLKVELGMEFDDLYDEYSTTIDESHEEENNLLTPPYSLSPTQSLEVVNPCISKMDISVESPYYYDALQHPNYGSTENSPPRHANYLPFNNCRIEYVSSHCLSMAAVPSWSPIPYHSADQWVASGALILAGYNNTHRYDDYL